MKEIIRNINGVAGRTVTVTGLAEPTMTRDNVLGILNGTQNEVLYVPMFYGDLLGVTYSNGTLTITLADTVPAIANGDKLFVKLYSDYSDPSQAAEDLAEFFGLPEALPEIEVATEQEVKDINDDVIGALYGYGKVTVTIHSLMRTGAETTQDLASVIYVDPEKTWAENGYPTLYDDEGNAIDTTTNPAAGDEVFNYQIQSES